MAAARSPPSSTSADTEGLPGHAAFRRTSGGVRPGNTANHLLSWSRELGAQAIARNLIVQEPGHAFAITGPRRRHLG